MRPGPRARGPFADALFVSAFFVSACGGKVPPQSAAARGIVLSEAAAPSDYIKLGELSVKSGKGCGVLGEAGSRENAEALLRNEAENLRASYVQVTRIESPRANHQCLEHEYKLSGVAYRSPAAAAALAATSSVRPALSSRAPSSSSAPSSSPSPSPGPPAGVASAAPAVCVPGATQGCLGPGACSGAQACRDDASGFLPCDCGPARPLTRAPILRPRPQEALK